MRPGVRFSGGFARSTSKIGRWTARRGLFEGHPDLDRPSVAEDVEDHRVADQVFAANVPQKVVHRPVNSFPVETDDYVPGFQPDCLERRMDELVLPERGPRLRQAE